MCSLCSGRTYCGTRRIPSNGCTGSGYWRCSGLRILWARISFETVVASFPIVRATSTLLDLFWIPIWMRSRWSGGPASSAVRCAKFFLTLTYPSNLHVDHLSMTIVYQKRARNMPTGTSWTTNFLWLPPDRNLLLQFTYGSKKVNNYWIIGKTSL